MSDPIFTRAWFRQELFRLASLFPRIRQRNLGQVPYSVNRILILAPVLRGDFLIMTPLIVAIAHARPRAELAVVVTKPSYEIAQCDPLIRKVFLYAKLPGWFSSIVEIIHYHPEVVVLPKGHPAFTESLLLVLTRAPYRIGLSHPHHDLLLTHAIPHDWDQEHRSEAFSRLMTPFSIDPSAISRRLHIGRNPAAEYWAENQMTIVKDKKALLVSLNLSASQPSRKWTLENWKNLLEQLGKQFENIQILAISSPLDVLMCSNLAESFPFVHAFQTKSFMEAVALIARTCLLITVDTGIVQAAAARNIPMVVLYNGDHEVYTRFAPQSVPHRAILAGRGLPVASIQPDTVFNEVLILIHEISP